MGGFLIFDKNCLIFYLLSIYTFKTKILFIEKIYYYK